MVRKLTIYGHVHNRPHEPISASYSWPLGRDMHNVVRKVTGFNRAFVLKRIELEWMGLTK